jgi:hypothetical protein
MALEEPTWSILKLRQADFESRMNEYGKEVSGVGIVLNSPDNHMIPNAYARTMLQQRSRIQVACNNGMQVAQGAKSLDWKYAVTRN